MVSFIILHIISCLLSSGNEHDFSALPVMILYERFYAPNRNRKHPSIYQVRKMENRARKAEIFTENSHLLLSCTITNCRRWSYPSTYLPGNLEKWGDFSEKFTKCLQIAFWRWWHENLPHLTTEKIPFWTMILRIFCLKLKCSPLCLNRCEIFCMIYQQYDRLLHRVRCSYFYGESSCGKCQIVRQQSGNLHSDPYDPIVIINSFPLLKLCTRENRHEQTVNSPKNHAQKLKNHGR